MGAMPKTLAALAIAVAGLASVAGCGKAQAKTPGPVPAPALSAPEPPPRLTIPVSVEPPPAPPAVEKPPPPVTPTRPRPTPTPTPTPPPTPPPTSETPPVLQAGSAAELEARARERIASAERDLGRVSRGSLPSAARDQYDSADRFIRMAKDALTARNVVYAVYCADKAATLASLLGKGELQ